MLRLIVVEVLLPVDLAAGDVALGGLLQIGLRVGLRLGLDLRGFDGLVEHRHQFGRGLVQLGLGAVGRFFQERVLLHLGADEIDQLQARELQELDRLLQLGSHHQLLAEAKVLLELERHREVSRLL